MALSTRADNLLLLLYAPGSEGQVNPVVSSVARLHHLLFLLQQEGRLWLPRGRVHRYQYVQGDHGLYSADFLDDVFALHVLGCLELEAGRTGESQREFLDVRRYFRDLAHGDRILKEFQDVANGSVCLSPARGLHLGGLLYDSLAREEQDYLRQFKVRFADLEFSVLVRTERVGAGQEAAAGPPAAGARAAADPPAQRGGAG